MKANTLYITYKKKESSDTTIVFSKLIKKLKSKIQSRKKSKNRSYLQNNIRVTKGSMESFKHVKTKEAAYNILAKRNKKNIKVAVYCDSCYNPVTDEPIKLKINN